MKQDPGPDEKIKPRRRKFSVQPLGGNQNPEGIELLVADKESIKDGHGRKVSYVANSGINKKLDIETILLEDGVPREPCLMWDAFSTMAKMKSPPEVIVISLGLTPASATMDVLSRKLGYGKFMPYDETNWPEYLVRGYRYELSKNANYFISYSNSRLNSFCDDGIKLSEKRSEALNSLVNSGVTVVFGAGNDGEMSYEMKYLGIEEPRGLFESQFYSYGEILPAGVIVAGGSMIHADGSRSAAPFSNPSPAVDVLADSVDVIVDARGLRALGTSYAAPKVAALAANILSINPKLSPAQVEEIIKFTATPLEGPKDKVGAGVINVKAAIKAARATL